MIKRFGGRAIAFVLVGIAQLLAAAPRCRADTDRSVLEAARRATGFVFVDFGKMASMGTAFCIDSSTGLFVTNNHVISDGGQFGGISVVLSPGTPAARILNATVVKADADMDLALIRVERSNNLHAVDLAGDGRLGRLRETQEVMALGYPLGLKLAAPGSAPEVTVSTGRITSLRHVKSVLAEIQFDGSINHGNSGGPLLDRLGNVIGVVSAILKERQINIAIPATFVRVLLADANIVIAPAALGDAQLSAEVINDLLTPPRGRLAVPGAGAQQASLKLVKDLFATAYADRSKAGQENLVYALLDESNTEKDDAASRYALLSEAKEAGIRAGDYPAAVSAAVELTTLYDVPSRDLLADVVRRIGPKVAGQEAADAATVSLLIAESYAKQQAFAEARKWYASTRAVAYASHNAKVVAAVGERLGRLEAIAAESDRGQAALTKLKSDPKDAEANLAAGEYECFVRGDFTAGCALLAKGSSAGLQHAAQADRAKPATAPDQRSCGDLWWDLATAEAKTPGAASAANAEACKARAVYWYRLALPTLTGLVKRAVAQRIEESGLEPEPAPPAAVASARSSSSSSPPPSTDRAHGGTFTVTNRTDAREAKDVIEQIARAYPLSISNSATYELVKYHDARDFRANSGAKLRSVSGTFSGGGAMAGNAGGPMLWGIYENWDAGHYLIVYRVQALTEPKGDKVCMLDVCSKQRTIAEYRPKASEFQEGTWSCMPILLNLDSPRELEFRLWPYNKTTIAVDRVYVFRMH